MKYISKEDNNGKVVKLKNYKRRAKINRIKRKLLMIFILFVILLIILMFAPFMNISKISCVGNSKISSEEIISSSNILIGDNIIRTNKSKAISLIKKNPYIKSVDIKKKYPSTITITIKESKMCSYLVNNGNFIILDEDGKVLEVSDAKPEEMIPLVEGFEKVSYKVNEVIKPDGDFQLDVYKSLINTLSDSAFDGIVTNINISDVNNIVYTVNDTYVIKLGSIDNIEYKIKFIATEAYTSRGSTKEETLTIMNGRAFLGDAKEKTEPEDTGENNTEQSDNNENVDKTE